MHINNRSLTKPAVHRFAVFFHDFSFRCFSALLTDPQANTTQAGLVPLAGPGREKRMTKGPRYAADLDLNANLSAHTTATRTGVGQLWAWTVSSENLK